MVKTVRLQDEVHNKLRLLLSLSSEKSMNGLINTLCDTYSVAPSIESYSEVLKYNGKRDNLWRLKSILKNTDVEIKRLNESKATADIASLNELSIKLTNWQEFREDLSKSIALKEKYAVTPEVVNEA